MREWSGSCLLFEKCFVWLLPSDDELPSEIGWSQVGTRQSVKLIEKYQLGKKVETFRVVHDTDTCQADYARHSNLDYTIRKRRIQRQWMPNSEQCGYNTIIRHTSGANDYY